MSALAGTDVPVPRTFADCDRRRRSRGAVLRDGADRRGRLPQGGPARRARRRTGPPRSRRRLVDALADLHAVDPAAVGLGEFGRPDGFLEPARSAAGASSSTPPAPASSPTPTSCTAADRAASTGAADERLGARDRARRLPARQLLVASDGTCRRSARSSTGRWPRSATRCTDLALMLVYDQLAAQAGGDIVADVARRRAIRATTESARGVRRASAAASLGDMGLHLGAGLLQARRDPARASTTATSRARPSARASTGSARRFDLHRRAPALHAIEGETDGLRATTPAPRSCASSCSPSWTSTSTRPSRSSTASSTALDDPCAWSTAPGAPASCAPRPRRAGPVEPLPARPGEPRRAA